MNKNVDLSHKVMANSIISSSKDSEYRLNKQTDFSEIVQTIAYFLLTVTTIMGGVILYIISHID